MHALNANIITMIIQQPPSEFLSSLLHQTNDCTLQKRPIQSVVQMAKVHIHHQLGGHLRNPIDAMPTSASIQREMWHACHPDHVSSQKTLSLLSKSNQPAAGVSFCILAAITSRDDSRAEITWIWYTWLTCQLADIWSRHLISCPTKAASTSTYSHSTHPQAPSWRNI